MEDCLEIKLFDFRDLEGYDFREEDLAFFDQYGITARDIFEHSTHAYVLLHEGKPLTLVGASPRSIGVYSIYQYPRRDFQDHIKVFVKGMRHVQEAFMNDTGAHRLETICEDDKKFYNWMTKGLGWEFECVLKSFGKNKEDLIQYRYVR